MTKTPQKPRLLVTGSTGRLGPLLRAAWARWPDAPVLPVFAARRRPADLVLDDPDTGRDLPQCDTVVALWGRTSGDAAQLAINTELARRSRDLALACGADRVLHLSSAAIYGPGQNMDEAQMPAPRTPYGEAKLDMERAVSTFVGRPVRHTCLRLANVVGADSLAPALCADAPVLLDRFADGTGPMRSYICPGDVARVLTALSLLPAGALPDVLNVAAPGAVAMAALARAAGREITWTPAPAEATQCVTLNTDRLQALLPGLALRKSADRMIADWQTLRDA